MKGMVYIVGAGPGDPGLITVRGCDCIRKSQVVIYDYLASERLLDYAPKGAEQIYVGKKAGDHALSQDAINRLIVEKACQGVTVTRLKGGDPFIFGRGGEEGQCLRQAGVPFEVVPGVTSAIAAPAYAGIPLTHRGFTSTVAFVTGHEDPAKEASVIDWQSLARGMGTIVFLMGVKNLPQITKNLTACGRSPDTPVAVVRWGTTPAQRTITGTLGSIAGLAARNAVKPPAVLVVGEVVLLRESLNWFEERPLFGKTVVVTRAREQASDLVHRLTQWGAECIECPTIVIEPPEDPHPLRASVRGLSSYDWVVFTSVNGVGFFLDALFAAGLDVRALGAKGIAAIGPATAGSLRKFGLVADLVPETYRAESVVEAFRDRQMGGKRVLLPRAGGARTVLPEQLVKMGAQVEEVVAYETRPVRDHGDALVRRMERGEVDLVTFTSSSTVKNFVSLLPAGRSDLLMKGVVVACIGPVTAETARDLGLNVDIVATDFTIAGLCDAVLEHYAAQADTGKGRA